MYVTIDSNILHGCLNPEASTQMSAILNRAQHFQWRVGISRPVLIEIENGAKEALLKAKAQIAETKIDVASLGIAQDVGLIDVEKGLSDFSAALNQFLKKREIEIIPFSSSVTAVEDIFQRAVRREPPFDDRGTFRDPTIYFSYIEWAQKVSQDVYFVCKDNKFRAACLRASCKPPNFKPVSFEEFIEVCNANQNQQERAKQEKMERQVKSILEGNPKPLETAVTRSVSDIPFGAQFSFQKVDSVKFLQPTATGSSFIVNATGSMTSLNDSSVPTYFWDPLTGKNKVHSFRPISTLTPFEYKVAAVADAKADQQGQPLSIEIRPIKDE